MIPWLSLLLATAGLVPATAAARPNPDVRSREARSSISIPSSPSAVPGGLIAAADEDDEAEAGPESRSARFLRLDVRPALDFLGVELVRPALAPIAALSRARRPSLQPHESPRGPPVPAL